MRWCDRSRAMSIIDRLPQGRKHPKPFLRTLVCLLHRPPRANHIRRRLPPRVHRRDEVPRLQQAQQILHKSSHLLEQSAAAGASHALILNFIFFPLEDAPSGSSSRPGGKRHAPEEAADQLRLHRVALGLENVEVVSFSSSQGRAARRVTPTMAASLLGYVGVEGGW